MFLRPEPDPDGDLLHDPALPADRAGLRRASRPGSACCPPRSAMLFIAARRLGARRAGRRGRSSAPGLVLRARRGRILLLATIEPELDDADFAVAMAVLGVGMGLIVSQLGNVVQSAVGDRDRSEAGGLQYTAQQLGSSLGTALIGAVLISGLVGAFTANVADTRRSPTRPSRRSGSGSRARSASSPPTRSRPRPPTRGSTDRGRGAGRRLRGRPARALKTALLFAGFIVLGSFAGPATCRPSAGGRARGVGDLALGRPRGRRQPRRFPVADVRPMSRPTSRSEPTRRDGIEVARTKAGGRSPARPRRSIPRAAPARPGRT